MKGMSPRANDVVLGRSRASGRVYAAVMDAEREWWRRTLAVPVRPRPVFTALRSEEEEDFDARQEPLLAIVWLAGIAWVLADPVTGSIFDEPEYDWLVTAVWAFVYGGIVGFGAYWILGGCLALGLRGVGGESSYRRARHVLAFAGVPFVLSLVVFALRLMAHGGDVLSAGGDDEGALGTTLYGIQLGFAAWTLALAVYGVRVVERLSWLRVAGALGLLALFLLAFVVLAESIF